MTGAEHASGGHSVQISYYPSVPVRARLSTMSSYGEYCPIAVGVDVLGDRWTPLIIRELMVGSTGFNEIHRGVPRMSRSLLAQRLRTLERRGLVQRTGGDPGRSGSYTLTPAGVGLTPIVWAIGHWAAEWNFGDPTDEECDGLSLLWRMHQHAIPAKLPQQRTVVQMELTGVGAAEGWLCLERRGATVCKDDPGYQVDLAVQGDTRQLQRWLIGLVPFRELVRKGDVRLLGPSRLSRAFPTWFDTSFFAKGLRRAELHRADGTTNTTGNTNATGNTTTGHTAHDDTGDQQIDREPLRRSAMA